MQTMGFRLIRHTRQFDAMLVFYCDQLGFTLFYSWDRPHNRGALLSPFPDSTHTAIEVLQLGEIAVPRPDPPVNTEVSIEIDNAQAWHDRFVAVGATIARGIEDADWGHRAFGVDDPDGLRLWFYQDLNRDS